MSPDDPVTRRIFEARGDIRWADMAALSFPGNPAIDGEAGTKNEPSTHDEARNGNGRLPRASCPIGRPKVVESYQGRGLVSSFLGPRNPAASFLLWSASRAAMAAVRCRAPGQRVRTAPARAGDGMGGPKERGSEVRGTGGKGSGPTGAGLAGGTRGTANAQGAV